jgi:UDP-2,3-diacylglucosamine hydrolase
VKGQRKGKTLFISDLHLDDSRPRIIEEFERFMQGVVPGADALFILGDLFEYWVGDDGLELPLPGRVAEILAASAREQPVRFMHGNRDFMVAERFARETGVELIADPTVVDLYGTRTLLMHGDTLCTDDQAYQRFRAQVRNPAWQAAALTRPLAERLAIARGMREESDAAKEGKTMGIMDVAAPAVEEAFARSGCDVMIHGHTHRPARHSHGVEGRERVRWVLPDWYAKGGYLEASPEGVRAVGEF